MVYLFCLLYSFLFIYLSVGYYHSNTLIISKKAQILIMLVPVCLWIIILGSQNSVGTDYESYYSLFSGADVGLYDRKKEYLFVFLCNFINKNNLNPQIGFYLFSILQMFFLYLFILKVNFERLDIFIYVFFTCSTFFINQLNGLRQFLAADIFMLAYLLLKEKKYFLYIIMLIFASMFHRSSLFLIFFVFTNSFFSKVSKKLLYLEIIISFILMVVGVDKILLLPIKYTSYASYLNTDYYISGNRASVINIATKLIYLPYIVLVVSKIQKVKESNIQLLQFGIFSYCFKLVSMSSFFMRRFSYYFDGFLCLPIYYYILLILEDDNLPKYRKVNKILIFLILSFGPFFIKTIISPSAEYLYTSIFKI